MKNSRKYFIMIEIVLGILVLILAVFMLEERNRDTLGKVSVIVSDSDGAQWTAFKYGIRMAAQDRKIDVVIVATESMLTPEEEEKLIKSEMDNGADAVIVQPVPGENAEEMLKKAEKKIPVMLVDGSACPYGEESELPVTGADNGQLGETLAEEIRKDFGENLEGKTVGIISDTTDLAVTGGRMEDFCRSILQMGAKIRWCVSGNFDRKDMYFLQYEEKVDVVAALDDRSLTAAGEYASAGKLKQTFVYGIGHSTEAAYYLDSGAVECLVVPDGFNVGYQSMCEVADCLENFFHKAGDREISYTVLHRDTLFSKKGQEILFTMSQ